jgi:hypothetical protein
VRHAVETHNHHVHLQGFIVVVDAKWKDHQSNEDDLTEAQVANMGFVMVRSRTC